MLRQVLLTSSILLASSCGTPADDGTPSAEFTRAVETAARAEKLQALFNGNDLSGWDGDQQYWSVVNGQIRGANEGTVPTSTYLFTEKPYRNFRLLLEVKQTMSDRHSTMHSAVAALGERFMDEGNNAHGFKGPLLMFCHDWGIWDAYRRNRVVPREAGAKAERKGEWNLIEILVIDNRIRFAVNGQPAFDFTDKPEMLQASPIGLQLHSNKQPQEYHFRGLVLTENPQERLVTTQTAAIYTQTVERSDSVERGAAAEPVEQQTTATTKTMLESGPKPKWIWGPEQDREYWLLHSFDASDIKTATLIATSDNSMQISLNGKNVATSDTWENPVTVDVTNKLLDGKNQIVANVNNAGGISAFIFKLALLDNDGNVHHIISDDSWQVATSAGAKASLEVTVRGEYGMDPWRTVFDGADESTSRIPRGTFEVLPGFQVEKLFTVPKDELGSWVCIAFDNKGRLLASDQGDKGICRITLPPVLSSSVTSSLLPRPGGEGARRSDEGATAQKDAPLTAGNARLSARNAPLTPALSPRGGGEGAVGETIVELLDFSKCEYQPSGAQGMLWAFDSLYLSCNGGPGSGLYRARDLDGDDQFDECVRLTVFKGGGEHGPHSLRLSPDGKRIFVIAGNHTDPPFNPGEQLENENYSSRVPTNWGEDLLLPRMWDANGHARGKLAPGGWIASTDPEGKTWDIWSIGYRNPYDMAFNADGDLFAYDADMEWDVGSPWYRPTRVVHATSGSEFGWRSGTGKWPTYYIDSLPPLVDIGPGSPVGVDFGYGLRFPAKYQKALYICDWTFGTMYAIHTTPKDSSYTATKEEFVSRTPLPLTDCAAGPDGALYFTIGGRGTQSELFRVSYAGPESTAPADLQSRDEFVTARAQRRQIERTHTGEISWAEAFSSIDPSKVGDILRDRFLRNALRISVSRKEFVPVMQQALKERQKATALSALADQDLVASRVATLPEVAGQFDLAELRAWIVDGLPERSAFGAASADDQLGILRSVSVACIRLGEPTDDERSRLLALFEPSFPSDDQRLNRELCQMLVYLNSPTVVAKTVELMKRESSVTAEEMADLLARNPGYGNAINAMLSNPPDQQQIWYAFCLRVAAAGWTPETRADYFRWFGRSQDWSGGNSFRKFLQNIENEAYERLTENERVLLEASGARQPFRIEQLPQPSGPGKAYSLEDVLAIADGDGLTGSSFENGQKMFAAARCSLCHRFAGDGGATGPDLTQLAGRFSVQSLTEAIIDPNKVISDQYRGSSILTVDGKTVTGRIVSGNDKQISVLTDPEDSTKIVDIQKSDIDEMTPSQVSLMPADLLKTLNEEEVRDLMAYLLSRGDKNDPLFRK